MGRLRKSKSQRPLLKQQRQHSSKKNFVADHLPWDHYSFDLREGADLDRPALRTKVEILETQAGFCMFYPKHPPPPTARQQPTKRASSSSTSSSPRSRPIASEQRNPVNDSSFSSANDSSIDEEDASPVRHLKPSWKSTPSIATRILLDQSRGSSSSRSHRSIDRDGRQPLWP